LLEKYFKQNYRNTEIDEESNQKICMILAVLYSEEEEPTCLNASCNSSWGNALFRVDGGKICTRWPQHVFRSSKHFCTHRDVFLLHDSRDGTAVPKVHLVEEISHYYANGKFDVRYLALLRI